MFLHGKFINLQGAEVEVRILTRGDDSRELVIGEDGGSVFFSDDPVEVASEVNDTFDHLLRSSCTIRLQSRDYIPELYQPNCLDTAVNVLKDGVCVFAGYVEPLTYSQGYNELYDDIEVNCVDALSALQYLNYGGVGEAGVDYDQLREAATRKTFMDILTSALAKVTENLVIGTGTIRCLYDRSKAVDETTAHRDTVFSDISISELLMLGDDEEDVWTLQDTVEEMMRYLNLHIVQEGFTFRIFDWASVKAGSAISWLDLLSGQAVAGTFADVTISEANVADTDTQLDIGMVYNQVTVNCEIKEIEELMEDPLDDESLSSDYDSYVHYVREYDLRKVDGNLFARMVDDDETALNDKETRTDWYIQTMKVKGWTFPMTSALLTADVSEVGTGWSNADKDMDINAFFKRKNTTPSGMMVDQELVMDWVGRHITAGVFKVGSIKKTLDGKDNSVIGKLDLKPLLYVSCVDAARADNTSRPYGMYLIHRIADTALPDAVLKEAQPLAIYHGPGAGTLLTPADSLTKNYIVISGKMVLNSPGDSYVDTDHAGWIPGRDENGVTCYTRKYYKTFPAYYRQEERDGKRYEVYVPKSETSIDPAIKWWGLYPFSGDDRKYYKYKYSEVGESIDKVSKVSLLACMLRIGDKVLVEDGINKDYISNGTISDFHWYDYKPMEECEDEDEYYAQCFFIGIDPKIDDWQMGQEFDIANNIDFSMGLGVEGMAVPITSADRISGDVEFTILGPVNNLYNNYTRRHKTWFRSEKWTQTEQQMLLNASAVIVKDFKMRVYTDSGLLTNTEDNDLAYVSDTDESFVNKKDNTTFRFVSALTRSECATLGVTNRLHLSMPFDESAGCGILSIYDRVRDLVEKPEKLYVDAYYQEYHEPRLTITQTLRDSQFVDAFNHYRLPAAGKDFYVYGMSRNLMAGEVTLNLKEIEP